MKKFFDKVLMSNLWLQILVAVGIIVVISALSSFLLQGLLHQDPAAQESYSQNMQGFFQLIDTGSIKETIGFLDQPDGEGSGRLAPTVIAVTLLTWLIGTIIFCFVTGAIVNAFDSRKEKITSGAARYRFKGHGVLIGWDFQGVASVMALQDIYKVKDILIASEQSAEQIRAELQNVFNDATMKRIYIYNGCVSCLENLEALYLHRTKCVIILGDRNDDFNDGGNRKLATLVMDQIHRRVWRYKTFQRFVNKTRATSTFGEAYFNYLQKCPDKGKAELTERKKWRTALAYAYYKLRRRERYPETPIQVILDISSVYHISQNETFPYNGFYGQDFIDISILNFYKATAVELFSSFAALQNYNIGRRKGIYETPYAPLAFRRNPEANHVHVVFSGFNDMARALLLQCAEIMPVGKQPNRITIFSTDAEAIEKFKGHYDLDALQHVVVEFVASDIYARDCRQRIIDIARDISASVTLFITHDKPDLALEAYACLPNEIRNENIRVLIEQRVLSTLLSQPRILSRIGFPNVAFFGMLDRYYSSIATRDHLACKTYQIINRIPDDDVINKWRTETMGYAKPRIEADSFANALLEKLHSVGYDFRYAPEGTTPTTLSPEDINALLPSEHVRNVNAQIANNWVAAPESDDYLFTSDTIVPWEETPDTLKANYTRVLSHVSDLINTTFNCGDTPYAIQPEGFRRILGILPFANTTYTPYTHTIIRRFIGNKSLMPAGKLSRLAINKTASSTRSFALLCTLDDPVSMDVFLRAIRDAIPVILLLPCDREAYEQRFPEGYEREKIQRCIRNAYTYYVIEDDAERMAFIKSHSDELLFPETTPYTPAETQGEIATRTLPYLPPRKPTHTHSVVITEGKCTVTRTKLVE